MFYIVETEKQLDALRGFSNRKGYIEVIPSNDLYHPRLTYTVAVYLRPLDQMQGYIIPICHDEGLNIDKHTVLELLSSYTVLYTPNRKQLLYHFILQNAVDLSLISAMKFKGKIEFPQETPIHNLLYRQHEDLPQLNQLLPITKLYEHCEDRFDCIKDLIEEEIPQGFSFYNNLATNVLYLVEQSGIRVDVNSYAEMFKPRNTRFNIEGEKVFTSYNLYNITSRPTNSFNSVNFVAIPKSLEHRRVFKPDNDEFVEIDCDGYHVRLLCNQIGYHLTEDPAHKQLAKLYFNKKEISDHDYLQAKQMNFQAMYGGIPERYSHLEIFVKIQKFIDDLWRDYCEKGFIEDPISKRRLTKDLSNMNPQKLMNYLIQSLETSRNMTILQSVLQYLAKRKSKIVLYTYDAFIVDYSREDNLEDLVKIISEKGKYPVKIKYSQDFNF